MLKVLLRSHMFQGISKPECGSRKSDVHKERKQELRSENFLSSSTVIFYGEMWDGDKEGDFKVLINAL